MNIIFWAVIVILLAFILVVLFNLFEVQQIFWTAFIVIFLAGAVLSGYCYTPSSSGGGGCAKMPDRIPAVYVAPLEYQSYDCNQLAAELDRIQRNLAELVGIQKRAAREDAAATLLGTAFFLFPSLLDVKVGSGREAELGKLKGELDAVEQAAIHSNCEDITQYIAESKKKAQQ